MVYGTLVVAAITSLFGSIIIGDQMGIFLAIVLIINGLCALSDKRAMGEKEAKVSAVVLPVGIVFVSLLLGYPIHPNHQDPCHFRYGHWRNLVFSHFRSRSGLNLMSFVVIFMIHN